MGTIKTFKNQDTSFHFKKGQGRPPLSTLVAQPVSVAEYASTSLNMPKYP